MLDSKILFIESYNLWYCRGLLNSIMKVKTWSKLG